MQQPASLAEQPNALSASSLLAYLHEVSLHSREKEIPIDSCSHIALGNVIPEHLVEKLWTHAYKQSEDELLLMLPTHESSFSLMQSALQAFPGIDSRVLPAWTVLQPFLTAMTPENLNMRMHNGVSFAFSLSSDGGIVKSRVNLAVDDPLVTFDPLINLSTKPGNRAFDVFYHFYFSQSEDSEWEDLISLKSDISKYDLLNKSGTYHLPSWVTFADDYTLAKDWADAVSQIFPKKFCRSLMFALSGILLMGNYETSMDDFVEGATLVGLDADKASQYTPQDLISVTYKSLLYSVETMINRYLANLSRAATGSESDVVCAVVTLAELTNSPSHRHYVLRGVFDNQYALNAEMVQNGIDLPSTPGNVTKAIQKLNSSSKSHMLKMLPISDVKALLADGSIADWYKDVDDVNGFDLSELMLSNRLWNVLGVATGNTTESICLPDQWSSNLVSSQIRDTFVTEWAARSKLVNYTADYDNVDFISTFSQLLPPEPTNATVAQWAGEHFTASQFFQGYNRVYLDERTWMALENQLVNIHSYGITPQPWAEPPMAVSSFTAPQPHMQSGDLLSSAHSTQAPKSLAPSDPSAHLHQPGTAREVPSQVHQALEENYLDGDSDDEEVRLSDDNLEDEQLLQDVKEADDGQHLEVTSQSRTRKVWIAFVWLVTFWIPSPLLTWIGGMDRRDVRLAWREKITIFFLIVLFNGGIIFYMIILGRLICPDYDKVWNHKQLSYHQGNKDFYVGIHGNVYDITKFYSLQHSDNGIRTSSSIMLPVAGQDISDYFPPPLNIACPSLVSDSNFELMYNTTRSPYSEMLHKSGPDLVPDNTTALHKITWYQKVFQPKIKNYYKGRIVETAKDIKKKVDEDSNRYIIIIDKVIYDMSNYMQTINQYPSSESPSFKKYNFFPDSVTNIFMNYQGQDATDPWKSLDEKTRSNAMECMNNAFVYGYIDFRHTAKCQAANVILLVMAGLLTSITVIKFLSAVRFGSKPSPILQDRFVICQVPVYTEGEDDVRLAFDSLANMDYDNRRKLMVILCDGMITGAGNDRPTPQIILDLLGVDESRVKAEAKPYHAIAEGAKELNFAKVYSGLYENEGTLVPFICIVKCGVEGESRPGNRGKRDSQLILMNFLNRVHYGDPMSPLDLEIFHHINNIIGIEPERFEFLLTIDADTQVKPDALNRMVAACTSDNSISAVCGETGIENEKQSLSTMVQVYEYFISHHLTKAFESLFGSITCLPGCFSLFRLRTVQKCKPLFISSDVIREYSLRHVDTLHKKNLFSLGEDRYLTTLMSKNFSRMKMKFVADAQCLTRVPDDFSVLLSQRRRWINSTVHNLAELLLLNNMCGFCLFSMRGIVLTDLIGTLMLPSVVIYLVYLIYVMASHTAPLPLISIILIASVYGLQALVFIMHQQWQHIFWMLVYILAYPFHSFILPIYSFWNMDNFSWGNTRVVIDESKGRKVVLQDDEDVYNPRSVPFETWHSYATRMGLPGRERPIIYDARRGKIEREIYEDPAVYAESIHNGPESAQYHKSASPDPQSSFAGYAPYSDVQSRTPYDTTDLKSPFDAGTEAQIRDTIQQVLVSSDLDTMTSRQLRTKVSDLLGTEFAGDRAATVDIMIDQELERMDDFSADEDAEPVGQYFDVEDEDLSDHH